MVSKPHGQKLVNLTQDYGKLDDTKELERIDLTFEEAITMENIATGVFSPLEGPMREEDVANVVEEMRLKNDIPWTMPVLFGFSKEETERCGKGDEVCLTFKGKPVATMALEEVFGFDKENYCAKVYGTTDGQHPGVAKIMQSDDLQASGTIKLIGAVPNDFENFSLTPSETRVLFEEKRWKTICAFQTRNAPHVGHEYLQKTALSFCDGVFINPVIGKKKTGDFKDEVILASYRALVRDYYPKDSVVLSVLRYEMQYAGPMEAVMHAIMRKNYGCTHIAIGRDHAGVGNFYKPYAAQDIFKEFPDLGISPLFFKEFFYCTKCAGIANERICPHSNEDHLNFSGTKLRAIFESGEKPPAEFMRPEVANAILGYEKPFVD
jgi:sulfate adenylyltransferase